MIESKLDHGDDFAMMLTSFIYGDADDESIAYGGLREKCPL